MRAVADERGEGGSGATGQATRERGGRTVEGGAEKGVGGAREAFVRRMRAPQLTFFFLLARALIPRLNRHYGDFFFCSFISLMMMMIELCVWRRPVSQLLQSRSVLGLG